MQKQVLNYRIIIEPEKMGKKIVYNAYCDTLGLADYGDSVDEAIKNIKSLMKFHIECLLEEELIMSTKVSIEGSGVDSQVIVA